MSLEDKAQEQELMQWELNNRARVAPVSYKPGDVGYGPEFCDSCDADMPEPRRKWGFTVCVDCQTATEAKQKHQR